MRADSNGAQILQKMLNFYSIHKQHYKSSQHKTIRLQKYIGCNAPLLSVSALGLELVLISLFPPFPFTSPRYITA